MPGNKMASNVESVRCLSGVICNGGAAVLTVEYKLNLVAPGDGEQIIGRGRVLKSGHTLTIRIGNSKALFKQ